MKLHELASALISFEQENSGLAEQQRQLTAAEGVVEECARRVQEVRSLLADAEASLLQAEQAKQTLAEGVAVGLDRHRSQEVKIYAVMADMVTRFHGGAPPVSSVSSELPGMTTVEHEPESVIPEAICPDPEPIPAPVEAVVYCDGAIETPVREPSEAHQVEEPPMPVAQPPAPVAPAGPKAEEKQPGVLLSFLSRFRKGESKQAESFDWSELKAPPAPTRTAQAPAAVPLKKVVGCGPIFTIE